MTVLFKYDNWSQNKKGSPQFSQTCFVDFNNRYIFQATGIWADHWDVIWDTLKKEVVRLPPGGLTVARNQHGVVLDTNPTTICLMRNKRSCPLFEDCGRWGLALENWT